MTPTHKWMPVVDEDKCSGCELCANACGPRCLEMQEGLAVLTVPDACGSEEHCIGLCADDAIQMAWLAWKGDGNSRRLRLTRPEAMRLRDDGLAEESAGFGAGVTLVYRLQSVATPGLVRAEFHQGTVLVIIPSETAQAWAISDEVGVCAQAGPLQISIEKDFRCLTHSDEEEEERDAFPHPADPPVADPGGATCRS